MSKHTPGPWKQCIFNGIEQTTIQATDKSLVAAASYRQGDKSWSANARLIAAAPELLEALKHCADWMAAVTLSEDTPVLMQARAAIAKAEGA